MKAKGLNQHQQSQSNTNLSSSWLQRAGVREVPGKEVESSVVESGLNRSFVNVPVHGGGLPVVQRKLTIGAAGDRYEREAGRVASQVVQQINTPVSARATQGESVQRQEDEQQATQTQLNNKTGLPDNLKVGVENLSGIAMDDVKVHYNSNKPAQLQAYAYTEGTDIHVASGQEKHLPHEAWHVVQQKQGRVQPKVQLKRINANVDFLLEKEASIMGAKANDIGDVVSRLPSTFENQQSSQLLGRSTEILQRPIGTRVRQFGNGGTVKNTGSEEAIIAREKLVTDGIVTDNNEILNVEVARN
ncbi:MAG: DUF4157 domain-containing protein, partial [Rivularia sp. (in: cyanobacteria)]